MSDLRQILLDIRAEHGRLTPQIVLDVARAPEHPLHSRFEWDDAVAAEKWRREQAHDLIQSVKISYAAPNGTRSELRAFHAVRSEQGHVYDPTEEIVQDEIATRILLKQMEQDWRSLKNRWSGFKQFADMVRADLEAS